MFVENSHIDMTLEKNCVSPAKLHTKIKQLGIKLLLHVYTQLDLDIVCFTIMNILQ